MIEAPKRILISRTDSIGDVMLTLPLCVWLKKQFPAVQLVFLGRTYTQPVVACFTPIDEFIDWSLLEVKSDSEVKLEIQQWNIDTVIHVFPSKRIAKITKMAGITRRIGTSHRIFHWLTCNERISFTRKNSPLHEAQLNFHLLKGFGCIQLPSLTEVQEMTNQFQVKKVDLPDEITAFCSDPYVILHPKSQGSALEWPINKYIELAAKLMDSGCKVVFTGTEKEGDLFREILPQDARCMDTTGKLSLNQLIALISAAKALVACSTGPLHIAGVCGIKTVGLYSPRVPIHPGRWSALGKNVQTLVFDPKCDKCATGKLCYCIQDIQISSVLNIIA